MLYADVKKYAKKVPTLPEYPLKKQFQEVYDEMAVHTRKRKPTNLLLKRRPNEPDDVLEYRVNNYEPITYGSMNKAFDNLYRIANGINYTLGVDDKIREYMDTKNFMKNSFAVFFTKVYLKRMIEDPNGFLAWLPGGEGSTDNTKNVLSYPVLLYSFNLVDWREDVVTFLSEEKSVIVESNGTETSAGNIYMIFTKDTYYRLIQKAGGKYDLETVYKHNLGVFPLVDLGGDLTSEGLYESFFSPYVAFGNEAIRTFSDWQAISTTSAFPIREEFFTSCDIIERPSKEDATDPTKKNKKFKHDRIRKPMGKSPHGVIERELHNPLGDTGEPFLPYEIDSVRFYGPDITYVQQAETSYKNLILAAEDALHLNLGDVALSGKAKEIDLLSHEDMLGKIALQYLDAQQISARLITAYYNVAPYEKTPIKLTKPNTFRIKTEEELMAELMALKTNKAPAMLVAAVARELAQRRFSGDLINQKMFEVIATFDPLFIYSVEEKQSMAIAGNINKDFVTQSNLMYSILLQICKEKGEAAFLELENPVINELFLEAVKPYLVTPLTITTDNNGNPA